MKRNKILIVEDVEINRMMLAEIFRDEYEILEAKDGKEGIEIFVKNFTSIAVVFLDLMMPVMDGFKVLELLSRKKLLSKVPFILITGQDSAEIEKKSYEYGVVQYVRKPYHADVLRQIVKNVTELYEYKTKLEAVVRRQNAQLNEQSEQSGQSETADTRSEVEIVVDALSDLVEFRNMESEYHIKRIREFTKCLGTGIMEKYPEYELTPEKVEIITQMSAIHDIGKIMIPDDIVLKPGKLSPDEYEVMKSHTTKGAEIISRILGTEDNEYFDYCYDIVRHHHEKYDGNGYPDGLQGDEINIAAQIVSLADAYDGLVSRRIYQTANQPDKVHQMILNGERGIFSPKLLDVFNAVKPEMDAIASEYSEEDELL